MSHFQIFIFSIVLILLIFMAAFFACAETGLMAVNRYRLRHKARMKKRSAVRILQLLKRPDRVLGAILIGSTFANMLASSLATIIAAHFWGDEGAIIVAILLTFVVLIVAEITPKTLAAIYPEGVSRVVAIPIRIIIKLLYPFVWFANSISNGLLRILHIRVTDRVVEPLSREELRSIVYDTKGKISRQYQNMLLGILDMSKLTVDDVMIPTHEIQGIDISHTWEEIALQLSKFQHEHVPIYRENINQMQGIIYSRNIVSLLVSGKPIDKKLFLEYIQEPYFVPEGTLLNAQLSYFQKHHDKVAFVVDEYGEIQGMLTMNDILEEIVGDFTSNMLGERRITEQPDGTYIVDGATMLREFNRTTDWELPLHGPRTVSGLIIEYLEALPQPGIAMLIGGYPIEILQVKGNRVKLAKISPRLQGHD